MVLKLLWAIKYSKSPFNQTTRGIWLSTVNFLYHGLMQRHNRSYTDQLQPYGSSSNNNFLRGIPGPSLVVPLASACFIYLYIFDNKSLPSSKPVNAAPVMIALAGVRTNRLLWFDKAPALQLFLHNSICLHERPSACWMKVRSDTKMEVIPTLVRAVSICLLLFTASLKHSVFMPSSLLCVFWDKGAPWEQPDWGVLKDGLPEAFFTKKKGQVLSSVWILFRHLTRAAIFN